MNSLAYLRFVSKSIIKLYPQLIATLGRREVNNLMLRPTSISDVVRKDRTEYDAIQRIIPTVMLKVAKIKVLIQSIVRI